MKSKLKKSELTIENIENELIWLRYTRQSKNSAHDVFLRIWKFSITVDKSILQYRVYINYNKVKSDYSPYDYNYTWEIVFQGNRDDAVNYIFNNLNN